MAVSPILEIPEVAPTQIDKTTTMNDMIVAIEAATNAQMSPDFTSGDVTLSFTQFSRNEVFTCINASANHNLIIPQLTPTGALPAYRVFAVRNNTAHQITVKGATGATVVLAAGDAALIQSDGSNCYTYAVGGPGPTGGAVSIAYVFDTGTSNADPGNGKIRLNNSTENSATAIYVDILDNGGTDWTAVLDSLDDSTSPDKGQIRLFNSISPTNWILFQITAVTSHTHYRELTVTVTGSSATNPFASTDPVVLSFSRTGDLGSSTLAGDSDVSITSPASADHLVYDGAHWINTREPYIVGGFSGNSVFTASQVFLLHRFPVAVTFPANFGATSGPNAATSEGGTDTAATGSVTINIDQCPAASNPTSGGSWTNIGTMSLSASGHTITFATALGGPQSFAAGDYMRWVAPASPDATLCNVAATLAGHR